MLINKGSMKIKKRSRDKVSPYIVPLSILRSLDWSCFCKVELDLGHGISIQFGYHFNRVLWKSQVMHNQSSLSWSVVLNAELKSTCSKYKSCWLVFASDMMFITLCSCRIVVFLPSEALLRTAQDVVMFCIFV